MRNFFLLFFTFLLMLQSCQAPNNNFEGNIFDFKNKINNLNKSFNKSEKLSFSKKDIYHYEDFSYQPIGFYVTTIEKNTIGHTYILKSGGSESFTLNTDEYSKQGYFAYSFSYDSNNKRWKISIASQDYYIHSSGGSITHNQEVGNYKASYTISLSINDESLTISCNGYSEDKLNYSRGPWSSDYSQYYNPEIHNRYYYTFYTTEFRRDISNSQTFPIRVEKTPNFSIIKLENNQVRFEPENKTYPWRGKIVLSSPKFRCNQSYSQDVSGIGDKTYTLPNIDGEYSIEVIYEKHPENVFTGTLTIDSGINLNITFEKINNTLKVKPSDINKPWKGMITRQFVDPKCLPSPTPSPEPFSFEVFGTGEKIIDFPTIDATYLVQINYTECVTDSLFTTTMQVTGQCNNPPPTPTPNPTITPLPTPTPTITPVPTPTTTPSPTVTPSPTPNPSVTPTPSPTPPQPSPTPTSTPTSEPSPNPNSCSTDTNQKIDEFANELLKLTNDYNNNSSFSIKAIKDPDIDFLINQITKIKNSTNKIEAIINFTKNKEVIRILEKIFLKKGLFKIVNPIISLFSTVEDCYDFYQVISKFIDVLRQIDSIDYHIKLTKETLSSQTCFASDEDKKKLEKEIKELEHIFKNNDSIEKLNSILSKSQVLLYKIKNSCECKDGIPDFDKLDLDSRFTTDRTKHLEGTKDYEKSVKDAVKNVRIGRNTYGTVQVFINAQVINFVTNQLALKGKVNDCSRKGEVRYTLYFINPIGYNIFFDGNGNEVQRIPLHYGEIKVLNGKYHAVPRVEPAS